MISFLSLPSPRVFIYPVLAGCVHACVSHSYLPLVCALTRRASMRKSGWIAADGQEVVLLQESEVWKLVKLLCALVRLPSASPLHLRLCVPHGDAEIFFWDFGYGAVNQLPIHTPGQVNLFQSAGPVQPATSEEDSPFSLPLDAHSLCSFKRLLSWCLWPISTSS